MSVGTGIRRTWTVAVTGSGAPDYTSGIATGTPSQTVTSDQPLPVTMGTRAITYLTVALTAIGNTEVVPAQAGYKIRVKYFGYSNSDTADALVGLRFGSGNMTHRHYLVAGGGNVNANLLDCNWEGGSGVALNGNLNAAVAALPVYVTVGYTLEVVV